MIKRFHSKLSNSPCPPTCCGRWTICCTICWKTTLGKHFTVSALRGRVRRLLSSPVSRASEASKDRPLLLWPRRHTMQRGQVPSVLRFPSSPGGTGAVLTSIHLIRTKIQKGKALHHFKPASSGKTTEDTTSSRENHARAELELS